MITVRDLGNVLLDRASRTGLRARLAVQDTLGLTHRYQPDPLNHTNARDPRECRKRFGTMKAAVSTLDQPSTLDVGCNQGFFTISFASMGGLCVGIDNDRAELMAARARAEINRIRNVTFVEMTLDARNVHGLPQFDIVVCLSIFHHWVRLFGRDAAEGMLAAVASRARHAMFFDTGQPEETETRWADQLSFMHPSGRDWIENHLRCLGFGSVEHLGAFETSLSPVARDLFVARRV